MKYKDIEILNSRLTEIVTDTANWVKATYPNRTNEFEKCTRDLTYIYKTLCECVDKESVYPMQLLSYMFFKNGKLQIIQKNVEIKTYYILRDKLFMEDLSLGRIREDQLSESAKDIINSALNVLIHNIDKGIDDVPLPLEKWKDRHTCRIFDKTIDVDPQDLEYFKKLFSFIPTQQAQIDHIWITLTYNDSEFRTWLLENVFNYSRNGVTEYMIQVINAPVCFLAIEIDDDRFSFTDTNRNVGIHTGVIMSEAVSRNYNVATLGCREAMFNVPDKKEKIKTFNLKINELFGEKIKALMQVETLPIFYPNLAVCLGKQLYRGVQRPHFRDYEGYRFHSSEKTKKPYANIID